MNKEQKLLLDLAEYLEKQSAAYMRHKNYDAAVAVDGIGFWLTNELKTWNNKTTNKEQSCKH